MYTGGRLVSITDIVSLELHRWLTLASTLRILSRPFCGHYISLFLVQISGKYGAEHEAHISTKQPPSQEDSWLPCAHGYEEWSCHCAYPSRQGPQASVRLNARRAGPVKGSPANGLPREARLTKKPQFDVVHRKGARSSDAFFRVLAIPNDQGRPRLGLAVGQVERLHELAVEALAQRMGRGDRFERGDDLGRGTVA